VSQLLALAARAVLWRRGHRSGCSPRPLSRFAAASIAPLWANAAEDSLVVRAVEHATPAQRLIQVSRPANTGDAANDRIPDFALADVRRITASSRHSMPA
jgi:hypothetical protein